MIECGLDGWMESRWMNRDVDGLFRWVSGGLDGWMDECLDGWIDRLMDEWMFKWVIASWLDGCLIGWNQMQNI